MNSLDTFATVHDVTSAFRAISFVIQAEAYIVPDLQPMHLNLVRADGAFIWSAKMAAAPLETVATHCLNLDKVGFGAVDRDTSNRLYRNSQRTWQSPSQGDARLFMHPNLRARLSAATGFNEAILDVLHAQAQALKEWLGVEGYTKIECEVPIRKREASGADFNCIADLIARADGTCLIVDHKSGGGSFAGYFAHLEAY